MFTQPLETERINNLTTAAVVASLDAAPANASSVGYALDPSHGQIVFSYSHLGYSTNYGMFSGFEGTVDFNQQNPAASSVNVSFPVRSMLTGWEERFEHFM